MYDTVFGGVMQLKRRLKQHGVHALRSMRLLTQVERLYVHWTTRQGQNDNAKFCREHPDFIPPPMAAIHDAYGATSFRSYWDGGRHTAEWLAGLIHTHHPDVGRVLEWGCGPARILRHLPEFLPAGTQLFGTDYNQESIAWCKRTIEKITFSENALSPPLPFEGGSFDVIYAVSVLTHLSAHQQDAWIKELRRLLRPKGHLILTTHGEKSAKVLLPHEYARFQKDGIVIRGSVEEGTRCFLSYNHPDYAKNHLFSGMRVCEHIPGHSAEATSLWGATNVEQDTWILQ
jgi:SAM-dependent methyltransferase